jgi:hypothetical protein
MTSGLTLGVKFFSLAFFLEGLPVFARMFDWIPIPAADIFPPVR